MRVVYPSSAVVGQDKAKLALILNVIEPYLGGVLIMGHRGTGKSTAVRALADLLTSKSCCGLHSWKPGKRCRPTTATFRQRRFAGRLQGETLIRDTTTEASSPAHVCAARFLMGAIKIYRRWLRASQLYGPRARPGAAPGSDG